MKLSYFGLLVFSTGFFLGMTTNTTVIQKLVQLEQENTKLKQQIDQQKLGCYKMFDQELVKKLWCAK